ncbi:TetR/AcrR family transcriptional regulator [Dactylosporangium sp. CA-152071]|uniref:TetR/AcrR family transcriptional regulator n=1 Tax=Dactylosporangium sp. CA-152071 TaxID=3239933 RepID=UPI003D90629F
MPALAPDQPGHPAPGNDFADRLATWMTGLEIGRGTGRSVHVCSPITAKARDGVITFVAEVQAGPRLEQRSAPGAIWPPAWRRATGHRRARRAEPASSGSLTILTRVVKMAVMDDARRYRVMKAAVATFARYGYRRTSMEVIAQAADMSRPALYQHFSNKEAVFREVTRWALDRSADHAQAAAAAAHSPDAGIEAILGVVLALHTPGLESNHFYELIDEVQLRAGDLWSQYEKRIVDAIRDLLVDSAERFDVACSVMDAEDIATLLFFGTKGISLESHAIEHRRHHVRVFVTAVLRGLAAS